jgi:hypothetical protein
MKKTIIFMSFFVLVMNLHSPLAFALESLSSDQMKQTIARAGIDIAINDVSTENYLENIRFYNPGTDDNFDPGDPHLSFNDVHILSSVNTGGKDMNADEIGRAHV